MARFVVMLLLLLPLLSYADIYKIIDAQGNVTYSDKPMPGSKAIFLPSIQTFQITPSAVKESNASQGSPETNPYISLTIVEPQNGAAVRQNAGTLTIIAHLKPSLREGDNVQLFVDGSPMMQPQAKMLFILNNVSRGRHTLQLLAMNAKRMTLIKSESITFYMLRTHIANINKAN